jgi:hypothetical protein
VLDCLGHSRFLDTPELRAELFHPDAIARDYATWIKRLQKFGAYKTRRALFKDMQNCGIECDGNVITMRPSRHEKPEGWSGEGFSEADNVLVPANASPAKIGIALRECFRRCT